MIYFLSQYIGEELQINKFSGALLKLCRVFFWAVKIECVSLASISLIFNI